MRPGLTRPITESRTLAIQTPSARSSPPAALPPALPVSIKSLRALDGFVRIFGRVEFGVVEPTPPEGPWAERLFPSPTDHGIAEPDRAVTNVPSGTDTGEATGTTGARWYEGGGRVGEKAHREIVVCPPTRGRPTRGDP